MNKDFGTRIIVSERTRELAGLSEFRFKRLGTTTVRGRKTPLVIYTVESAGAEA